MKPLWAAAAICLLLCLAGCRKDKGPAVPARQSKLTSASDVFWALDERGYAIVKEQPHQSRHGCKPSEYLAKKGDAIFRISVFHCGDFDQAKELVEHPKTRHVDELLRNHSEGGILQRGPLEIIIRMTQGKGQEAEELLHVLGSM